MFSEKDNYQKKSRTKIKMISAKEGELCIVKEAFLISS